jgi:hypothetical protein
VGDGGATLRQVGTLGAWTVVDAGADETDLVAAAGTADGELWAVGVEPAGSVLLRFDGTAGRWVVRGRAPGRELVAVAALPGGGAWAVGAGVACECALDACGCTTDLPFARDSGGGSPIGLDAVVALDLPGGPAVWAAGDYYVVRRAAEGWSATRQAYRLDGVPEGARVTGLAAAAEDDLWALATCRPYAEEGRGVGIVLRFRGGLATDADSVPTSEALAAGVPLSAIRVSGAAERRTVWAVGDWSTLLARTYQGGPAPESPPRQAPDLRCLRSEASGGP